MKVHWLKIVKYKSDEIIKLEFDKDINELEKQANLLVSSVGNIDKFKTPIEADSIANDLGKASNSRVTFIKNNGQVIGDSELNIDQIGLIDNHISKK